MKKNQAFFTRLGDQNIVNQLAGRAAGVTVLGSAGGNMGGSARITIRGMRSLTGNNQPLFVVDGIPMDNSNFNSNPQHAATGGGTYQSTGAANTQSVHYRANNYFDGGYYITKWDLYDGSFIKLRPRRPNDGEGVHAAKRRLTSDITEAFGIPSPSSI